MDAIVRILVRMHSNIQIGLRQKMENYKKKPLKFVGMGREVRAATLTTARSSSRHQIFSLQRPTNDAEGSKETISSNSGIPISGNKNSQSSLRAEKLKKWKEEKLLRKQIELQTKKPVFKVGVVKQPIYSSSLYESDNSSRIQKSCSSKNPTLYDKTSMKSKESDGKPAAKSQAAVIKPRVTENKSNIPSLKPPKHLVTTRPVTKETKSKTLPSLILPKSTFKPSCSAPVKQMEAIFRKQVEKPKLRKEPPRKETKVCSKSENRDSRVTDQLSSTKPVNTKKSFAPDKFVFTPFAKFEARLYMNKLENDLHAESRKTSTPKQSESKNREEQGSICIQETPSMKESSVKTNESLGNVPSSETKFILALLDNSSSDVKLPMPSSFQNMQSEQHQSIEILPQKRNITEIPLEVDDSQTDPSKQSLKTVLTEEFHPQVSVLNTDYVETIQSSVSSKVTDLQISAEPKQLLSPGLPAEKETTGESSILLKDSKTATPDLCFLEEEQEEALASSPCLLESDLERSVAPVVALPGKETDSVFLPPSIHDGTKSKRAAWHETSTLQKMSVRHEIGETPKGAGRRIAQHRVIDEEFTPRRSLRLARHNQVKSEENLFEVDEPSCMNFEESSRLTRDFDRLNLESEDTAKKPQRGKSIRPSTSSAAEVSLLYTPPRTRASTRIKSLGEDLMSFSPYV